MNLNVVILTLNEEQNLAEAIRSVPALLRVTVVDSGSDDGTVSCAKQLGADVVRHDFVSFSDQRNFALSLFPSDDFVFFLDADERLDSALANELLVIAGTGAAFNGAYVRKRNWFLGRELKHCGRYPDRQLKLMRAGAALFPPVLVHERPVVRGDVCNLFGHVLHRSNDDVARFLAKHARYAKLEAETVHAGQKQHWTSLFRGYVGRRRWLKYNVWFRLPMRPELRVGWLLIVKRGFLDGRPGLAYARMLGAYENMINAHLHSMAHQSAATALRK